MYAPTYDAGQNIPTSQCIVRTARTQLLQHNENTVFEDNPTLYLNTPLLIFLTPYVYQSTHPRFHIMLFVLYSSTLSRCHHSPCASPLSSSNRTRTRSLTTCTSALIPIFDFYPTSSSHASPLAVFHLHPLKQNSRIYIYILHLFNTRHLLDAPSLHIPPPSVSLHKLVPIIMAPLQTLERHNLMIKLLAGGAHEKWLEDRMVSTLPSKSEKMLGPLLTS